MAHDRAKPGNKGPDGSNAEKPLKIDLPFEEAGRRAMRAGKPSEAPNRGMRGRRANGSRLANDTSRTA